MFFFGYGHRITFGSVTIIKRLAIEALWVPTTIKEIFSADMKPPSLASLGGRLFIIGRMHIKINFGIVLLLFASIAEGAWPVSPSLLNQCRVRLRNLISMARPSVKPYVLSPGIQLRSEKVQARIREIIHDERVDKVKVIDMLYEVAVESKFTERDLAYLLEHIPRGVRGGKRGGVDDIFQGGVRRGIVDEHHYYNEHFYNQTGYKDVMVVHGALQNTDMIYDEAAYGRLFPSIEDILHESRNWTVKGIGHTKIERRWALLYTLRSVYLEAAKRVLGRESSLETNHAQLQWIGGIADKRIRLSSYRQFLMEREAISESDLRMILEGLPRGVMWGVSMDNGEIVQDAVNFGFQKWPLLWIGLDMHILYKALTILRISRRNQYIFEYLPAIVGIIKRSRSFSVHNDTYQGDILETFYLKMGERIGVDLFQSENGGISRYLDFLFEYFSGDELFGRLSFFLEKNPKLNDADLARIDRRLSG